MTHRLEYKQGGEMIDEFVMHNANVHLEQLDDHIFMLICEDERYHFHMRVGTKGRGKVDAWIFEYEDNLEKV
jgi:hypothetical protein